MKAMLSIKPEYVAKILSGEKRYEFRRRIFSRKDVDAIVIYSTSPESSVVAEVGVTGIISGTPQEVWEQTGRSSGITQSKFMSYFAGVEEAHAIELGAVDVFEPPLPLSVYSSVIKRPPQSFVYLDSGCTVN